MGGCGGTARAAYMPPLQHNVNGWPVGDAYMRPVPPSLYNQNSPCGTHRRGNFFYFICATSTFSTS